MKYIAVLLFGVVVALALLTLVPEPQSAQRQQAQASVTCIGLLNLGCNATVDQSQEQPAPKSDPFGDIIVWVIGGVAVIGIGWAALRHTGGYDAS